jgi:hypothetical protein
MALDDVDVGGGDAGVVERGAETFCWEVPLGAVMPLDAPSWLMAVPRTRARTRRARARHRSAARGQGRRRLPRDRSRRRWREKVLERPSGAKARRRERTTKGSERP